MTIEHESPEAVVRAALAALHDKRWVDLLPLVRPVALRAHRDLHLRYLVAMEAAPARDAGTIRAEQPWLSAPDAAERARQAAEHRAAALPALRAVWGVVSLRELDALSPADFLVRFLAATDGSPAGETAGRWRVLGEVMEDDRLAHVVYREAPSGMAASAFESMPVRVTTLDRADGLWWLRVDDTLLARPVAHAVWRPADVEAKSSDRHTPHP